MARNGSYIAALCLSLLACGTKSQLNGTPHLASEEAGSAETRPVEAGELHEPKRPVSTPHPMAPSQEREMVSAPVPVSGTFLKAKIMDEETVFVDSVRIGIAVYKDGMRVASEGQRFQFDISLDELSSPNVKVRKDLIASSRAEFDKEIRVYGNSIAEIKAAFPFIVIKTKVDDRMLNIISNKTENLSDLLAK